MSRNFLILPGHIDAKQLTPVPRINDIISMSAPWEADGPHVYATDHGWKYRIASAKMPKVSKEYHHDVACLLAAAPELLDCLKAVMQTAHTDREWPEVYRKARQAIAKATLKS